MKERISLTIEKDLLKKVDEIVDKTYIRNRSQAFEVLLKEKFLGKINKSLILLGGPNSEHKIDGKYRPFVEIGNKSLIVHQIEKLKEIGSNEILIAAGDLTDKLFNFLGDGSSLGIRITFLNEGNNVGSAGAVKLAKPYIKNTFVVLYGDVYFDFDLKEIIDFHKNRNSVATLGLITVEMGSTSDNLVLEGEYIKSFEYTKKSKGFITNTGIQVFEPSIFKCLPEKGSLEKDVFPKLSNERKLLGYVYSGKWRHLK